jgi:hypothetical protein
MAAGDGRRAGFVGSEATSHTVDLGERTGPGHDLAVNAPRPLSAPVSGDADEPVAAVEAMIAELGRLRQRTQDRALLGAYQAALDRLDVLAYRLKPDTGRTIGLPARPVKPVGETPRRALPPGPVEVERKPRRR